MTGKFGLVALVLLSVANLAAAGELAIVSGGRRIIDRDPASAKSNCSGWTYGPSPLVDDSGNVVAMYTVSDAIEMHCGVPLESPERFGDVIQRHELNPDGTWSSGTNVIGRENLPWMSDAAFLAAHPETFVGHLSSPSVARVDGRYFMVFAASVNDPNLCAGEHPAGGNVCGSCRDPWSYFVAMWAVSDDGVHWRVRERGPGNAMLLGGTPRPDSYYQGVTRVMLIPREEPDRKYFYIGAQYWAAATSKILMLRIPYDASSEWGISADPEMWSWNRQQWVPCPDGVLPAAIDGREEQSLLMMFDPLSSISTTTIRGTEEYIALTVNSSYALPGPHGLANRIAYQFSSDLVDWSYPQVLRSAIPYFADGYSYDASAIDPVVVDDHGALRLFLASADGDEAFGIGRDGVHDCHPGSGFGVTAPYVGTGIYEARIEPVEPRPTRTDVTIDRASVIAGQPIHCRISVLDANGDPADGVVEIYTDSISRFRLSQGHAEGDVMFGSTGIRLLQVSFARQGLWQYSSAAVAVKVSPNTSRRRAVHR